MKFTTELFAAKGINLKKLKSPNLYSGGFEMPPEDPGVYFLVATNFSSRDIKRHDIAYIGSSANLHKRYKNHEVIKKLQTIFDHVSFYFFQCSNFVSVEKALIKMIRPEFNSHKYLLS